jgi:dTDP-4-dehydrorhamnose reductase
VSPTLNTNLAEMLLEITERKIIGILHTAGATRVSRHEFSLKLADAFNLNTSLIKPAKISDMQWKAKRPRDPSLNIKQSKHPLRLKTPKTQPSSRDNEKRKNLFPNICLFLIV